MTLADVYDAFHRLNKKSGVIKTNTKEDVKEGMLNFHHDLRHLIEELYISRIFGVEE